MIQKLYNRAQIIEDIEIKIPGVIINKLERFNDERGWLSECFRHDEIDKEIYPVMAYISITYPGRIRGPHEHLIQTDYFCFIGSSTFKLYLWDNRWGYSTHGAKMSILLREDNPTIVIIPPHVVHAYKNVGKKEGLILNFPNKLYAGWSKKEKVDEVRYENNPDSPFRVEV